MVGKGSFVVVVEVEAEKRIMTALVFAGRAEAEEKAKDGGERHRKEAAYICYPPVCQRSSFLGRCARPRKG